MPETTPAQTETLHLPFVACDCTSELCQVVYDARGFPAMRVPSSARAFVVCAVNRHAALVAALKECSFRLAALVAASGDCSEANGRALDAAIAALKDVTHD